LDTTNHLIKEIKRAGGVAQVVGHLPSKLKTLSSKPINTNKKERKKNHILHFEIMLQRKK
jgi:methyl coenzyme M reductase subunit D